MILSATTVHMYNSINQPISPLIVRPYQLQYMYDVRLQSAAGLAESLSPPACNSTIRTLTRNGLAYGSSPSDPSSPDPVRNTHSFASEQ